MERGTGIVFTASAALHSPGPIGEVTAQVWAACAPKIAALRVLGLAPAAAIEDSSEGSSNMDPPPPSNAQTNRSVRWISYRAAPSARKHKKKRVKRSFFSGFFPGFFSGIFPGIF